GIARAARGEAQPATMTQAGMAMGTVAYMSPEQALGELSVDARSDVYSLACVLYEMLSGTPPFEGPTAMSVLSKHITAVPPDIRARRAEVPPAMSTALLDALAKDPEARPKSAKDFASRLATSAERASATPSPLTNAAAAANLST